MTGINTKKNLTGEQNPIQANFDEYNDNSGIIEKETDSTETFDFNNEATNFGVNDNSKDNENNNILNAILADDIIIAENTNIENPDISFENEFSDNYNIESLYSITEEMTDEIINLSDQLNEQFKQKEADKNEKSDVGNSTKTKKRIKYHTGSASAALSLIFMGIALIYGLFSVNGIVQVFRLSPVMLVFLGVEILLNTIIRKSVRFKINLFDYALSGSLILITFLLSLCYVAFSNSELIKENIENRFEGEMNDFLIEEFSRLNTLIALDEENILIGNVESEISLYNEDLYGYKNLQNIQASDSVNIKIYFNVVQKSISKFASDCVKILAILKNADYSFDNVEFTSQEQSSYIYIKLNAKLQSEIKASEIMQIADYYIDNMDMDDLFYDEE